MLRLVIVLSILLTASLGLNVYLWMQPSAPNSTDTNLAVSSRPVTEFARSESLEAEQPAIPDPDTDPLAFIEQLINEGRLTQARDALHRALRADPLNSALLLLEARVVIETESVGSALIYLYDLLDVSLDDAQYEWVEGQIDTLSVSTINTLIDVNSWDILSAFVEPLWQYAPDNRTYILALAEAYAHQLLAAPMENVLASMLPEDPNVARIRDILLSARQSQSPATAPPAEADADIAPEREQGIAVPLNRQGDHFVVATQFDATDMNLMIDTGASTTVLTERAFARLSGASRRQFVGEFRINTAGGSFDAPLYRIDEMRLGPFALRELAVVVLPMENFRSADGLLGMNVLREFDFRIDQQNARLFLIP